MVPIFLTLFLLSLADISLGLNTTSQDLKVDCDVIPFLLPVYVPLWYNPKFCAEGICHCLNEAQSVSYNIVCNGDCKCFHGYEYGMCDFKRKQCICYGEWQYNLSICKNNFLAISFLMQNILQLLQQNMNPTYLISSFLEATTTTINDLPWLLEVLSHYPDLYPPNILSFS